MRCAAEMPDVGQRPLPSQLLALRWADVDLATDSLTVHRTKSDHPPARSGVRLMRVEPPRAFAVVRCLLFFVCAPAA